MDNGLFPTTVVGSMPRPQYIKDLIEAEAEESPLTTLLQRGGQEPLSKEGSGPRRDAPAGRLLRGQPLDPSPQPPPRGFHRMMDAAVPYVAQMQELAGIDIISDGEWRRKSYIGIIADICDGFESSIREVGGQRQTWHVAVDELEPVKPGLLAREARFLKAHTDREVKVALPSPYLLGQRMWDPELSARAYPTRRDFTEALVPILRHELEGLRDEGVAMAQFDDPQLCLFVDPKVRAEFDDPEGEMAYCVDMLNRIVDGVDGIRTALHLCRRNKGRAGWVGEGGYGPILPALRELQVDVLMMEFAMPVAGDKAVLRELPDRFGIGLGCVDCRSPQIDTPEEIADRVRQALEFVEPERIMLHPDCGFAPGSAADIPIDEAYLKLRNEAIAAHLLRAELG